MFSVLHKDTQLRGRVWTEARVISSVEPALLLWVQLLCHWASERWHTTLVNSKALGPQVL